jgi:FkbM family methyltransferase
MTQDERLGEIVEAYKANFGETANIIFDCGTRDGDDAAYLKEKLNGQQVYAIDASARAIVKTLANHPELIAIQTALSNYEGNALFTEIVSDRADYEGSSSFIVPDGFADVEQRQVMVPVTTMQSLIDNLGLTNTEIDVVKVDLEGYTYEFLEGMNDIRQVKLYHLETETFERHPGHYDNLAIIEVMLSNGFDLVSKSYEWGPNIEDLVWVRQE